MVQVDLPAAFTLGQLFAALAAPYLRREPHLFSHRLLGPFNFFMACGYVPVGMFLLIGWPAWEVMYLSGWLDEPFNRPWVAAFYVGFAVAMILLGNLGFILAHHWYRNGRDAWVHWGIAIGALLTVLPFGLRWGVWMRIGSYEEVVLNQGGYSFWDTPFFAGWAVIMSLMVIAIAGMGVIIKRFADRQAPDKDPPRPSGVSTGAKEPVHEPPYPT